MAEIEVSLDDDIARLMQSGKLKETEAIQLQTLRETQRMADDLRKKKEEPEESSVRFNITSRRS